MDLILCGLSIMLNVGVLGFNIIGVKIGNAWDVRVRNPAMVTLVEVVGQNLPVVLSVHFPAVVEHVFIEVVVLEPGLLVDTSEVLVPGNLRLFSGVHVDKNKAILVDMDMDGEQVVLGLVEAIEVLVTRSLCEIAVQAIGPSVILARKHEAVSLLLCDDGEGTVSADVVERMNAPFSVLDDNELVAGQVIPDPVSRVGDSGFVGREEPLPGEDGTSLQLVHSLRRVPGRW